MKVSFWKSSKRGGWISSRPSSRLVQLGGMFMLALVLSCVACREDSSSARKLEELRFTDDGIELTLLAPAPGATLDISLSDGTPIQTLSLRSRDLHPRMTFPWKSLQEYRFLLTYPSGSSSSPLTLTAPNRSPIRAILRFPYGQAETILTTEKKEPTVALTSGGGPVQMGLEIHSRAEESLDVRIELKPGPGLRFVGASQDERAAAGGEPASEKSAEQQLTFETTVSPSNSTVQLLRDVELPRGDGEYTFSVLLSFRPSEGGSAAAGSLQALPAKPATNMDGQVLLLARAAESLRNLLRVESHIFPTDARGRPERERMPDTVALPNSFWRTIGKLFQARALGFDPYAPFAFHTVVLENTTDFAMTLLVTARTLNPESGREEPAFSPQAFEVTGGTGQITSMVRIPPRKTGRAVVPFYLRKDVREGEYLNEVELKLLGSDAVLHRLTRPLHVVRSDRRVSITLLLVVPLSLCALVFFAANYRRLMARMDALALTTIALFGALLFTVGFLVDVLSTALNVILGPFNILVTGLAYEILHHLVLATLLVLYPRPGTATLVGLTQYLMRGLTTGQLSPVDILFVGSSLSFKELALYAAGVTRGTPFLERLRLGPRSATLRMIAALVTAGAATAFTSLALHTAFYRLFFASWYIWVTVLVAVIGAWPGAVIGVRFGEGLNRIRD